VILKHIIRYSVEAPPDYLKKKDLKTFGLSHEDTQDKNYWRLRIKEATG